MLSTSAHQTRHSQVLAGYPHISAGAYECNTYIYSWPNSKLAIFNFLHQSMCECILYALSVMQQVAKKLVFCCCCCFCSVRFVGALSGDCGFVSMVCMCVCFCVHGKKVNGPHEKVLRISLFT